MINKKWDKVLEEEFKKEYFKKLGIFVKNEYKNKGWEIFTDNIIKKLNEREEPIIFLLWGSFARSKKELITNKRHKIIESVHPSPLSASRGFFGSKPFSKINKFLQEMNKEEIKW